LPAKDQQGNIVKGSSWLQNHPKGDVQLVQGLSVRLPSVHCAMSISLRAHIMQRAMAAIARAARCTLTQEHSGKLARNFAVAW
jgi:hypothetical protein